MRWQHLSLTVLVGAGAFIAGSGCGAGPNTSSTPTKTDAPVISQSTTTGEAKKTVEPAATVVPATTAKSESPAPANVKAEPPVATATTPLPAGNQVAADWVKRLTQSRVLITEAQKRAGTKMPDPALTEWGASLEAVTNQKVEQLPLVRATSQFSPIWKGDEFLPKESSRYSDRVRQLPRKTIVAWQDALNAISGSRWSPIEVVMLLIQVDSLFDANGLRTERSDVLQTRLRRIPPATLDEFAELLKRKKAEVAVDLADSDWLFNAENRLDEKSVQEARKALQTS